MIWPISMLVTSWWRVGDRNPEHLSSTSSIPNYLQKIVRLDLVSPFHTWLTETWAVSHACNNFIAHCIKSTKKHEVTFRDVLQKSNWKIKKYFIFEIRKLYFEWNRRETEKENFSFGQVNFKGRLHEFS